MPCAVQSCRLTAPPAIARLSKCVAHVAKDAASFAWEKDVGRSVACVGDDIPLTLSEVYRGYLHCLCPENDEPGKTLTAHIKVGRENTSLPACDAHNRRSRKGSRVPAAASPYRSIPVPDSFELPEGLSSSRVVIPPAKRFILQSMQAGSHSPDAVESAV